MGGGYYDREVASVASTTRVNSTEADKAFSSRALDPQLNPFQRAIHSTGQTPIVICVDVTGSMGKWPKVIWDKLPMFFGQLMMKSYVPNPVFSFCAIGDAYGDNSPLQVTEFASGTVLDDLITKLHIEGGGVGLQSEHETYELAAYYYSNFCYFDVEPTQKPLFFITGDEHFYDQLNGEQVGKLITGEKIGDVSSESVWAALREKFNVFHLHKILDYGGPSDEAVVVSWKKAIGDDFVIRVNNPKACVDVMLGVIAISSGRRTKDTYALDMRERGQTEDRIAEVLAALAHLKFN
eukprot:TRINITY_DN8145_c0_g1_i1.p1 TRINITY_DN8145_c0_g1~~TRINITY_DN8145_c0_g1_i1.p1  ORF type:complete len:294 (+),score=67.95 TRINITY_DN8145_c0_g1_i1:40-921(+)